MKSVLSNKIDGMKSLLIVLLAVAFSSCHITQRYTFNRDFSGEVLHIVDYSKSLQNSVGVMNESSLFKEATLDSTELVEIKKSIEAIAGISGVLLSESNHKVELVCDFANLAALNNLLRNDSTIQNNVDQFCSFKRKGKKVTVHFDTEKLKKNNENPAPLGEVDDLYNAITYRFEFYFDQGVKKAKGTEHNKLEDGKTLVVEQSLKQISRPGFENDLVIKLR
jgi:hypothetical protein